jgi:hypothetical protein
MLDTFLTWLVLANTTLLLMMRIADILPFHFVTLTAIPLERSSASLIKSGQLTARDIHDNLNFINHLAFKN